jgi:membrane protease YdiL (CAAX protease family)
MHASGEERSMPNRQADEAHTPQPPPFSGREQLIEILVFLFLIVPSMVFSFFAVKQGSVGFTLTAVATILRDSALVALIAFFLWRNGESVGSLGWSFRRQDVLLGVLLFPAVFFGASVLEQFLLSIGFTTPATPSPSLRPTLDPVHLVLAIVLVLVVAVAEETIFRGYLILRFGDLTGLGWALPLSAFVFSLGHGYEGSAGVVTVGTMGLVFALLYVWRKSLATPMTIHFLQDFLVIVLLPLITGKQ